MTRSTGPHGHRRRRLRTGALVSAGALLLGGPLMGSALGDALVAEPYPDAERHAPSPMPDRIILTPTEDTATSQAVSWRTSSEVMTAQAEISPMAPGPSFDDAATAVPAQSTEPMMADLGFPVRFHTVTFEGLDADTDYLYRVGDGTNWSEWMEFQTASGGAEPFSFIYFGDAQNEVHEHVSRVFRRAFVDRPQADLIVHAGDLVDVSTRDNEWGEWFDAAGWINGGINSLAIPGNHEYRSGVLAPYWDKQFAFPDNGPESVNAEHPETAYHVDYEGVRFIGLNSNLNNDEDMQAQADYLDQALEENPGKWSVVTFHHPVFAMTGSRNNQRVRDYWDPIIQEHDVDLVLQGHDHTYGRGHQQNAEQGRSGIHDGTVYVVSVSGAKMYSLNDLGNWTDNGGQPVSTAEGVQLYQLIDVDDDTISYEARTADGVFHDGVRIEKRSNGAKQVYTVDEGGNRVKPGRG